TLNYVVFAQQCLADVMMTAAMVWALYFLLRIRDDDALRCVVGFYGCVGVAMLCKGPPGLAALMAAVVATSLADGRSGLRKLRPTVGALVLAVFALPWVIPYLMGARTAFVHEVVFGEYAHWFFRRGLFVRIVHIPSVLLYFVPWTLFLPAAVVWWRRNEADTGRRCVVWWTLTLWVVIGLSGVYRARYFLPVYPGLALLVGEFFARGAPSRVRREIQLGAIGFVVFSLAVLIAMIVGPIGLPGEASVYMADTLVERALIAVAVLIGMAGVWLTFRRDTLIGMGSVIAVMMGAILVIEGYTSPPRRAPYYDVPALGAAATAHLPSDGTLFAYPDLSLQYDVYVRRRIVEIGSDDLHRLLASPSRDAVILTRRRWTTAQPSAVAEWHVLESRTVGGVDIVLVGAPSDDN